MNSVLLLNVPPDTRGRIHENDAERLRQFGNYLSILFENELLIDGEMNGKLAQVLQGSIWSGREKQSILCCCRRISEKDNEWNLSL